MSDPLDTDSLMRACRSRLINALAGLSQIEEEMSEGQTPLLTVDSLDLIDQTTEKLIDTLSDLSTLRQSILYGDVTVPTPDSLEEEDPNE